MGFKKILKGLNKVLAVKGYTLTRIRKDKNGILRQDVFSRLHSRKHQFNTVIDIGASNGMWSADLMRYFPDARYFLIEAQPVHKVMLDKFCKVRQNATYVLAAAGDKIGEIYFDTSDPLGGLASYSPFAKNCLTVPVTTVDNEVSRNRLEGPFLLKFDTHGFEVPILKGAVDTLKKTEVIIIECYNFKVATESLLFYEMCQYLDGCGFRCIDLLEPLFRPYDNALWQIDLVFANKNRPEFAYRNYK